METPAVSPETLVVNGRAYDVTRQPATWEEQSPWQYELKGKRGALYTTVRNANDRTKMFLVHKTGGFGIPAGMQGVWLTDEGGTLRQVR